MYVRTPSNFILNESLSIDSRDSSSLTWKAMKIYLIKEKDEATLFIHGLCLKLEACGAVYMKQNTKITQA